MRYEAGKEVTFVSSSSMASICIQVSLGRKNHSISCEFTLPFYEESRRKICATCGFKVKSIRNISETTLKKINKFYPNFDIQDSHFPNSICSSCNNKVNDAFVNENKRYKLPDMPNYESMLLLQETRSGCSEKLKLYCCHICLKARCFGHLDLEVGVKK